MNKKQKKNLARIIISAVMLIALGFIPAEGVLRFVLYMVPYIIVGYDVLKKAAEGIINRQPFDENLLMCIATVCAVLLALLTQSGDYTEAVAVMLFYQVGEWFQSYAVDKSRKSIYDLMDIRPDYANIETGSGSLEQVDPDEVEIGTVIVVQPGERIPIDGIVEEGESSLNTAALTGESMPRDVRRGDEVLSGCINQNGVLRIRTTKEFDESTASKILELIEDAGMKKSRSENFISRFARIYTPIVVFSAAVLALVPPVVQMAAGAVPEWGTWVYRALTFLVISCPCALVISIPLSFFAGIGGASRAGILVKGSSYLETLSQARIVVFDKTGTLTKGSFEVSGVHPHEVSSEMLLHMSAHAERYSLHPIAASLRDAYENENDGCTVENIQEIAGRGIRATINGHTVCVGNSKMMEEEGAEPRSCSKTGTIVHTSIDGKYAGHIVISDGIKANSGHAIAALKKGGVHKTVMLTGDAKETAENVADELRIDHCYSELLPADKLYMVEQLLEQKNKENDKLVFVGDGINDAPVLCRADIGIAMGAIGSDAAIEAADVVLMDDDPLKIVTAIDISRKCMRIVKENIWFAIGVKVICLVLSAFGIANMWAAIFADVGVMVLAVLNAMRCMYIAPARIGTEVRSL